MMPIFGGELREGEAGSQGRKRDPRWATSSRGWQGPGRRSRVEGGGGGTQSRETAADAGMWRGEQGQVAEAGKWRVHGASI